ncbi:MAG: sugar nucleotide-binding protein, partial [Lachnospiraceae bacterium]|nr:sugar nucleotide-binding protein [Lachnospiraceae bacterium]
APTEVLAKQHYENFCRMTEEYGLSKAARPFNSRLDKSKLLRNGFTPLPDWKDALKRYLQEIQEI